MSATEFALIGHPLKHSLSPFIHEQLLAAAGLPGRYRLIDLPPEDLAGEAPALLSGLEGFNCTIPHKESIIAHLTGLDDAAARFRAVNTVWRGVGFNTDYQAFLNNCPAMADHRVLILGAGGVSRTMAFAAAASGAEVWIMSRRKEQAEALASAVWSACPSCRIRAVAGLDEFLAVETSGPAQGKPWALLNGTPLGLWPHTDGLPLPVEQLSRFSWVFDTIYNPPATRLILAARSRGIPAAGGLGMLFDQALAAQRIWHPQTDFPAEKVNAVRRRLALEILKQFPVNILLTGFMGSGKSTVGQMLAERLALSFVDLDQAIVETANQSITDIFAISGEPAFRSLERKKLDETIHLGRSQVIATGGGALIDPMAEALVRRTPALIVHLDTPLEAIRSRVDGGAGRPLLAGQGDERLVNLFIARRARYLNLADFRVDGKKRPEEITEAIAAGLGYEGEFR